jgi:hypothetical protein
MFAVLIHRDLWVADGDWHAEPCHPVEKIACNLDFGPLIAQNPSAQTPANGGLAAIHRDFDQALNTVARAALPGDAFMLRDYREMPVTLRCRGCRSTTAL